jgi:serine/threonine protein kinase
MPSSEPILDRVVGSYRLIALLGEGGAAHTYLAEDVNSGERLAVKELRLIKSGNSKQIELFERECATLRELDHPQIPRFVDNVVERRAETLSLYLVQELVEGDSLQQQIDAGRRCTARETVRILQSCLAPLTYLHDRNPPLYHRDIKPSNVIQRPDGSCVLVDFGAVREAILDDRSRGSSVVGTFGYMAPEQFQARAYPATDLYGLAATALHLLSGVEPGRFPLRRLKPEIGAFLRTDPYLTAILDILLEPAAEDRYSSVAALKGALDRWEEAHADDPEANLLAELATPDRDDKSPAPPPSQPTVTVSDEAATPSTSGRLERTDQLDSPSAVPVKSPDLWSRADAPQQLARSNGDVKAPVVTERAAASEMFVPGGLGSRELGPAVALVGAAVIALGVLGPVASGAVWIGLGIAIAVYGVVLATVPRRPAGRSTSAARSGDLADAEVRALVRRVSPLGGTEWLAEYDFEASDGIHYQNRVRLASARAAREVAADPGRLVARYSLADPEDSILIARP